MFKTQGFGTATWQIIPTERHNSKRFRVLIEGLEKDVWQLHEWFEQNNDDIRQCSSVEEVDSDGMLKIYMTFRKKCISTPNAAILCRSIEK